MTNYQQAKQVVRDYMSKMEEAPLGAEIEVLRSCTSEDYLWRGVYPFREVSSLEGAAESFWRPLKQSLNHLQRREDIFIAGENEHDGQHWVMSMGHFMGLFDHDWQGIKATHKMAMLRYAEFSCVVDGKITQTGLFVDLLGFMEQAGCYPLPPSTGRHFVYPGPRYHDGIHHEDASSDESAKTLALVNQMIDDLSSLNEFDDIQPQPELLAKTWAKDMIWYGPCGIGASYTIPRYQQQHQLPFRNNLKGKKFNGHVCRFAEGQFACFFGWPNLSNTPAGGFLGLPGGGVEADMQVVDVYYRRDDKLSENWVLIDIPYWLQQQGLDVLGRTNQIFNPASAQ